MNAQFRYNFLVGAVTIFSLVGATYSFLYLRGLLTGGPGISIKADFENAQGIAEGNEVRMAGVRIGQVESVGLTDDYKARLGLRIDGKYPIPRGSKFVIRGSLLGNTAVLSVEPRPGAASDYIKDGEIVQGSKPPGLFESALSDTQQAQADAILSSAEQTSRNIEKLTAVLADPKNTAELRRLNETLSSVRGITANMEATTRNFESGSEALPRLAAQVESQVSTLSFQANRVLANLEAASASGQRLAKNTEGLTTDLRAALNENRETLTSILQNADEAASAIAGLIGQLEETVGDDKLKANLIAATDNLASVSARLDATATNIQNLAADPRLNADIRETVANLKETSAAFRNLAERAETIRLPGERRRTESEPGTQTPRAPRAASATSLVESGLAIDSVYDTTLSRLRVDTNYTLLTGREDRFYRVGFHDLSETNRLNLQVGQWQGPDSDLAFRFGLFAGKFGAGADWRTGMFDWRLDLFDPNRFTANARLKAYLNRERTTSVTAGVDSVGNGNRAVLGVQIRN
jgi:ABC-type transport system involved in resistance to organic solvents, periplasmic component